MSHYYAYGDEHEELKARAEQACAASPDRASTEGDADIPVSAELILRLLAGIERAYPKCKYCSETMRPKILTCGVHLQEWEEER